MPKWDLQRAVKLIIDEKITNAGGLPYVVTELVESVLKQDGHCLETVSYGGSPSAHNLPNRIQNRLGNQVAPGQGYGSTETSSLATGVVGEDYVLREFNLASPSRP